MKLSQSRYPNKVSFNLFIKPCYIFRDVKKNATNHLTVKCFAGVDSLEDRLKWSLTGRWEDCLRHDWLPEDKSLRFHLMQYYTDLKWVKMVNLALRKEKKDLESIFDILKVKAAGRKPTKILVEGT